MEKKIQEIINFYGGQASLARALNVTRSCVAKWKERKAISSNYAIEIERISGGRFKARDIVSLKK